MMGVRNELRCFCEGENPGGGRQAVWGTYCRVKYKIVNGRLKEYSRAITLHEGDFVFEPPKVSEIIEFLKRHRPTAKECEGEYVLCQETKSGEE